MAELDKNQKIAFDQAEKALDRYDKQLLNIYRSSLTNIRAKLSVLNEKGQWSLNDMFKFDRLKKLQNQILKEIIELNRKQTGLLKKTEKEIVDNTYNRNWFGFEKEIQTSLNFTKINPDVIKAIVTEPYPGVSLNEMMRKNMLSAIETIKFEIGQSLTIGESVGKAARRIRDRLGIAYSQAKRIARTEGLRASSKAQLEASEKAKKLGIETTKIWLATKDIKTRDTHETANGQKAKNEIFTVGGVLFDAPRIVSEKNNNPNTAKEVINCRCTYYEELKDIDEKIKVTEKSQDLFSSINYDEWKKIKGV